MNLKVDKIVFSIVGDCLLAKVVHKELQDYPTSHKDADVVFNFLTANELPAHDSGFIHVDNLVFNAHKLYVTQNDTDYLIMNKIWGQNPLQVFIKRKSQRRIVEKAKNYGNPFLNWNYSTEIEMLSKNFMYKVFDYIIHLKLMEKGGAFLHASGVVKNSEAVLFTGWGGVGKTSLIMQLIEKRGWKFLSDDLIPVSESGMAFFNPKYLQVYPYNLEDNAWLYKRLMSNRSILDKINWAVRSKMYGAKAVRRRVSPFQLLGKDKIESEGKATKIVHLVRNNSKELKIHDLSKEDLSCYCTNVILNETKPLLNYILATRASSFDSPLPDLRTIITKCQEIYLNIFRRSDCFILYVPYNANPEKMFNFLIARDII